MVNHVGWNEDRSDVVEEDESGEISNSLKNILKFYITFNILKFYIRIIYDFFTCTIIIKNIYIFYKRKGGY